LAVTFGQTSKDSDKRLKMTKANIPFLSFALLLILTIPIFNFDYATSVVPGWHTIMLPPNTIAIIIIFILTLLATIAYWTLKTHGHKIAKAIFWTHLLCSIPAILLTRIPFLFLMLRGPDIQEIQKQLLLNEIILYSAYSLFIVGQIIFGAYFIKAIVQKQRLT
jgi:hypothetical protein